MHLFPGVHLKIAGLTAQICAQKLLILKTCKYFHQYFSEKNLILSFLDKSSNFESFFENSIFDPFCMGKIDFEIFNFLIKSENSEHFLKSFEYCHTSAHPKVSNH